ncbi:hypothetical protein pdam_00020879 [Pocillopora damicornis]|uniref:Uncharacterized protein n=1 Tax=Pocillopora damicornis TaxID=46731 RepID=A0A3M6UXY0_POCDA|nr:hypothetical protein pdam_00020879 [Pocillopora damicornis]
MQSKHCLTSVTLPDSVTIFSTNINVHVNEVSHRELSNLTESRTSLETLILRNHSGKTGYLMWILSYCITCIYQQNTKRDLWFWTEVFCKYLLFVDKLVEEITNIIQNKLECQTMEYDIQFICCSCKITEIERKHIMETVAKKEKARWVELCINQFKRKIREGPYFICTVCNQILYKKSAITCINKKYPCQTYFNIQQSFDGKQCICNTCHSKVIKGKFSCQAVVN